MLLHFNQVFEELRNGEMIMAKFGFFAGKEYIEKGEPLKARRFPKNYYYYFRNENKMEFFVDEIMANKILKDRIHNGG